MKFKSLIINLVVVAWFLSACQSAPVPPTPTAPMPATKTPAPTKPPEPTATATVIPEVGMPVSSANWEITLIDFSLLKRGVMDKELGGEVLPGNGARFVDVGFKAKSNGSLVSINTQNIMLVDENGLDRGAYYLGTQDANQEIDPLNIEVKRFMWMIGEEIDLSTEKFIHMIFEIPATSLGNTIYFRFDDVPLVPFTVEE